MSATSHCKVRLRRAGQALDPVATCLSSSHSTHLGLGAHACSRASDLSYMLDPHIDYSSQRHLEDQQLWTERNAACR